MAHISDLYIFVKHMLTSAELLELLLAEENVMDVVGALEHDPELAARQNHRAFLREHVIFKEVCAPHASTLRASCLLHSLTHSELPRHTDPS